MCTMYPDCFLPVFTLTSGELWSTLSPVLGEQFAEIVRSYRPSLPDPVNTGVGKQKGRYVLLHRGDPGQGSFFSAPANLTQPNNMKEEHQPWKPV